MQTATGQRHHAVRSFSTLIEVLHQSVRLSGNVGLLFYDRQHVEMAIAVRENTRTPLKIITLEAAARFQRQANGCAYQI